MKIVFFGSSNFAVPSLKALIASRHKIKCAVTQPDRQKGRGLHLQGTPVKTMSLESGLKIYQPEKINSGQVIEFLGGLGADLFVVSAYGQILSQEILDVPKEFCVNTHASLLPKYRGASPINWALINGETTTGITITKMTKGLDAGPIIMSKAIGIEESDTFHTLEEKLSQLAAYLLLDSLDDIENKSYKLMQQDEKNASLAPKLRKNDGLIDWAKHAQDIYNLIRGCLGWPCAFTYYKDKILKIYKSSVSPSQSFSDANSPGKIVNVSKDGITVSCGRASLIIEELQLEGKRRMNAAEFIAGHKICIGEALHKK